MATISPQDVAGTSEAAKLPSVGNYDVIVVGAGIVGSAVASQLGKQGRKVLLCERDLKEPDRIVGELLQPGGVEMLKKMGLEDTLKGMDAVEENGYCVFYKGKPVHLPYPQPFKGSSFHHGRFIMNLRKAAKDTPNVELRQITVNKLIEEDGVVKGVVCSEARVNKIALAPLTIVCDGCFSKFRGELSGNKPTAYSSFVGMVLNMPVGDMPFPSHGHVILADPAPILLYALSPNEIRILVDVPHPLPSSVDGSLRKYMEERVVPQLPVQFQGPFMESLNRERLRSMPSNQMSGKQSTKPGVLLLGDSFNMRHPLTGGGMTIGFTDAYLITTCLEGLNLADHKAIARAYAKFACKRTPPAATINILAMALYKVFSASDDNVLPLMREACFSYFLRGGIAASGPVELLAGITPNYWVLFAHFFAVAFYGVPPLLLPFPTPSRIATAWRLMAAATKIIVPLIVSEKVTFLKWFPRLALPPTETEKPAPAAKL